MKKLSDLNVGEKGLLSSVQDEILEQQLLEMGVTPGQLIEVERKSPFSDPIAIVVSHLLLSIRLSDANNIIISIENE
jgi:Fe2+ transport system protein FeoA